MILSDTSKIQICFGERINCYLVTSACGDNSVILVPRSFVAFGLVIVETTLHNDSNGFRGGARGIRRVSKTHVLKAPSTLIRFQTKTELFCSVFKKICVHTYRFGIVFARPHYNDQQEKSHMEPSVCHFGY